MGDSQRWQTYKDQLYSSYRSNCEQFDKAVLTLAAGGLGISLTLIKDSYGSVSPSLFWVLRGAWIAFSTAIISTLISFLLGQKSTNLAMEYAEEQIESCDDDSIVTNDENLVIKNQRFTKWTQWVNYLSATLFIFGVICTVSFAIVNADWKDKSQTRGESAMTQISEEETRPHPVTDVPALEGISAHPSPSPKTITPQPKPEPKTKE